MTNDRSWEASRPPLYELFDETGKAWLDELVRIVNDGAYGEAVDGFLAEEAAIAMEAIRHRSGDGHSPRTT